MNFIKTLKNTVLAGILLFGSAASVIAAKEVMEAKIQPTSGLVPFSTQKPVNPKIKPLAGSPLPQNIKQKNAKPEAKTSNGGLSSFFQKNKPKTPKNYPLAGKMTIPRQNSEK